MTKPEFYEDADERMDLIQSIGAVPFTAFIGFDEDTYSGETRLMIHLLTPTFDANAGVKHPLEPAVWITSPTAGCPPACLANTRFSPGVGLTVLHERGVETFRVLVVILDKARGAKRDGTGETVKVTREARCALRKEDDATTVRITQHALLEVATRFLQVPQNAYVHAIVAWRSADALTLLNLWHLPESEVAKFRQFFRKEVEVYDKMQGTASLEALVEETPLRIARQMSSASSSCSKQPWSVRAQLDFGSD